MTEEGVFIDTPAPVEPPDGFRHFKDVFTPG